MEQVAALAAVFGVGPSYLVDLGKDLSVLGEETQPRTTTEARAVGVVTGHTSRSTYDLDRPGRLYFPYARLQTADARTIEFQNKLGTNAPPRVGDEVTIIYDPERPQEAKVPLGSMFRPNLKQLAVVLGVFLTVVASMFLSVFALVVWISLS